MQQEFDQMGPLLCVIHKMKHLEMEQDFIQGKKRWKRFRFLHCDNVIMDERWVHFFKA